MLAPEITHALRAAREAGLRHGGSRPGIKAYALVMEFINDMFNVGERSAARMVECFPEWARRRFGDGGGLLLPGTGLAEPRALLQVFSDILDDGKLFSRDASDTLPPLNTFQFRPPRSPTAELRERSLLIAAAVQRAAQVDLHVLTDELRECLSTVSTSQVSSLTYGLALLGVKRLAGAVGRGLSIGASDLPPELCKAMLQEVSTTVLQLCRGATISDVLWEAHCLSPSQLLLGVRHLQYAGKLLLLHQLPSCDSVTFRFEDLGVQMWPKNP